MKKILLSATSAVLMMACGNETTTTSENQQKNDSISNVDTSGEEVCGKKYDSENTTIGFGGFKTTDRKEVKGTFKEFTIKETRIADTHEEVFMNAEFSIPVSSIETKDMARNKRLKEEYFGSMQSTHLIKGIVKQFNADSNTVTVNLKLNNIKKDINLDYVVSGDTITLTGSINVLDFDASNAISALNEVCESLHMGADGVTKTWPDVNLYISSVLKETCK